MEYSKLSDFEINLKVAHIILGSGNYDWSPEKKEVYLAGIDGGVFLPNGYFDPCNNPADAWPIIASNQISLMYEEVMGKWCAGKPYWVDGCEWQLDIDVMDANPLRSAMIFFLMMQEGQHA
ncbi:phage protein NinX family protein [Cronobacter sakazakii]|nr:DUF2591 family protein [Cronobacter sakazakii]